MGAWVDSDGVHPDAMPPLGEPLAGWTATQIALQECWSRHRHRRQGPGLRALVEDPLSPPDDAACRAMFDELCELQADALPF